MEHKLKLSADNIYAKEFSVDFKGYSAVEVDSFLDQVIQDYKLFEKILKEANSMITTLQSDHAQAKAIIIELEAKLRAYGNKEEISQVDLIKRIARLESMVYNSNE